MENILDRINKIALNEGITLTALERKIGASRGVLSRALHQKSDIQCKWLLLVIENYRHYDANWILLGEGKMYRDNISISNQVNESESIYEKNIKTEELSNKANSELIEIIKKLVEINDQNSRLISSFISKYHVEDPQTFNRDKKQT